MLTLKDLYDPNDEKGLIIYYDDKYELDECLSLSELLGDEVIFPNTFDYSRDGKVYGSTVTLFVNCSDVFYWACTDAENFNTSDIEELYLFHKTDKRWGTAMWCCKKRNMRPQKPLETIVRELGIWNDLLDSLPERDD